MSASTHPTVESTLVAESPKTPDPLARQKWTLRLYAIFAGLIAPLYVLGLLHWPLMAETASLPEADIYLLVVPITITMLFMAFFGALTLLVQRPWAAIGATVSGFLMAVAYLAPTMQHQRSVWGVAGVSFMIIAALLVSCVPLLFSTIKTLPPKDLLKPSAIYKVGTLRYTFFGLCMVFVWLLWGDFAFTLFDTNMPTILVLKLKDMGAGETLNSFLNKTIAYVIVFLFAPAVSFRSDRHRGKYGRRIPFLLWSTPFVGAFLVLIGCYESLTQLITGGAETVRFLGMNLSQGTVSLLIFAMLFVAWDFANIFVNTLYWYLFNDVVPDRLMSRFLSFFRIVGTFAGMFYSEWIFPIALDHFRFLFIAGGIGYIVGFMAMCFMIKEGDYPPPPPLVAKPTGRFEALTGKLFMAGVGRWLDNFIAQVQTYSKECFTHKFYWYFFLQSTFLFVSQQSAMFAVLRNRDSLGLSMKQMGHLAAITGVVSLFLQYPAGWASDRWNPIRMFIFATMISFLQYILQCVFLFTNYTPATNLLILYWIAFTLMPFQILQSAAELPMYMRLLPKDRYGQFCSANAMIRAFAMIFGSVLSGYFIEALGKYGQMGDFKYRFYPVWIAFFQIPMIIFLLLLYRDWKRRGGDAGYTPPAA